MLSPSEPGAIPDSGVFVPSDMSSSLVMFALGCAAQRRTTTCIVPNLSKCFAISRLFSGDLTVARCLSKSLSKIYKQYIISPLAYLAGMARISRVSQPIRHSAAAPPFVGL